MGVLTRLVQKIDKLVIKVDRKANRKCDGLSVWQILQHGRVMGLLDAQSMVVEEIENQEKDVLKRLIEKIDRTVKEMDTIACSAERNQSALTSYWRTKIMGLLDARSMVMEEIEKMESGE